MIDDAIRMLVSLELRFVIRSQTRLVYMQCIPGVQGTPDSCFNLFEGTSCGDRLFFYRAKLFEEYRLYVLNDLHIIIRL